MLNNDAPKSLIVVVILIFNCVLSLLYERLSRAEFGIACN